MTETNSPQHSGGAQPIFSVTCRNGHVTSFDKRHVCSSENRTVVRGLNTEGDELFLTCSQCDDVMIVRVDCEGYR